MRDRVTARGRLGLVAAHLALLAFSARGIAAQANAPTPLPLPTGKYAVGRTQFDWLDESRPDPADHSRPPELVVWVGTPPPLVPRLRQPFGCPENGASPLKPNMLRPTQRLAPQ